MVDNVAVDGSGVERRQVERGASLVEYALLLALVAIVCLVALGMLGSATEDVYANGSTMFRP